MTDHLPTFLKRLQRSVNIVHNPSMAWIVLVFSLLLTFAAYWFASNQVETRARERFEFRSKEVSNAIQERLLMYEQALRGGVGLVNASKEVTRREWAEYVRALRLSERLPGIQGIGYAVSINPERKDEFVESVRQKGVAEFTITPDGERSEYSAILYLEPDDWRNRRALGYDMWSDPIRREAMARARDEGVAATSAVTTLVQETERDVQRGFLMYLPVYEDVLDEPTVEERRERFVGWVYAPFRSGDLMRGILGMEDQDMDFEIYDGDTLSRETLIFDSDGELSLAESTARASFSLVLTMQLQGRPWSILFSTNFAEEAYIEESRQPFYILLAGIIVDTLLFYVLISLHLINRHARHARQDLMAKFQANQRDLAEQGRLVEASQKQSETFFELAPEAFLVMDDKGIVVKANHAAHALFGFAPGELAGVSADSLVPFGSRDTRTRLPAEYARRIESRRDNIGTVLEATKRNGDTFPATLNLVPVEIGGQWQTVAAVHDVSVQKQIEQALADAKEKAESANRSKSEFVANMSHEIRTPLNVVLGAAQLLNQAEPNPTQQKYIQMIRASGEALTGVINDILDFSKIEAGGMELTSVPFDINEILTRVAVMMSVSAGEKDIELVINVDRRVSHQMMGDPLRLQQILINLVSNAIKFTEAGSVVVSVSLRDKFADGTQVLRFACEDTGIGLNDQQQERLFKAFFQADATITRKFGGTGLGLVISNKIVELMGSRIHLSSQAGEGSCFYFDVVLPTTPQRASTPLFLPGTAKTILVVEDHQDSQQSLRNIFAGLRWTAHIISDQKTLSEATDFTQYDFLLFDYGMLELLGGNGLESLYKKGLSPTCGCVLIVGNNFQAQRVLQEDQGGFHSVLIKPIPRNALLQSLQEASLAAMQTPLFEEANTDAFQKSELQNVHALLVEDNVFNQAVACGLLNDMGVTVDTADNGLIAVERIEANPGYYDVVLMDIQMPVMDGVTAARQMIKNPRFTAPVIALTAGVLPSDREHYTRSGITDFVPKPIDGHELFRVLVNHLPRKRIRRGARGDLETSQNDQQQANGHENRRASDSKETHPELPIFNERRMLKLANGKATRIRELASALESVGKSTQEYYVNGIAELIRGNTTKARFEFHSLKGLAANYGGERLADTVLALEKGLRQGRSYADLERDLHFVEGQLKQFREQALAWSRNQLASSETVSE